jgi:outer membrane autotransporter protein
VSYQRTQASQDPRRSDGEVASYGVSVYGGVQAGALSLSGEAGYSQRDIDTTRRVLVGMVDETLRADYQAQALHVQARVGYPIATERGAIEPFVSLAYVSVDTDGFTEDGGSAALTRGDQSDSVTFATLGVRVMQEFGPNGRDGGLFGSLGLRHAEGDILPRSDMAFASNPGVSFTVAGAPIAENALALEGGIRWQLGENSSLTASYRGDIADEAQSHGASLRFAMAY